MTYKSSFSYVSIILTEVTSVLKKHTKFVAVSYIFIFRIYSYFTLTYLSGDRQK
jgi:uncharacterized protein YejL (UPF0352 family)